MPRDSIQTLRCGFGIKANGIKANGMEAGLHDVAMDRVWVEKAGKRVAERG